MTKPTKREQFVRISEVLSNLGASPDLVDFVVGEIKLIDKRKNAPRKPTKEQRENVALKERILGQLSLTEGVRATEIANSEGISVQKCSALLRQLVNDGLVIRETDKKVTTFRAKE